MNAHLNGGNHRGFSSYPLVIPTALTVIPTRVEESLRVHNHDQVSQLSPHVILTQEGSPAAAALTKTSGRILRGAPINERFIVPQNDLVGSGSRR